MLLHRKKSTVSNEEKEENTRKAARKLAQKSLAQSLQSLKSGDEKGALRILQKALIAYLMTKLNLSLSGLLFPCLYL